MHKLAWLPVSLLVILSLVLTACCPVVAPDDQPTDAQTGGGTPGTVPTTQAGGSRSERVRIVVYLGADVPEMGQAERAFVEEFNASQDRIELVMEYGPGGPSSGDMLRSMIEAGSPPDVIGPGVVDGPSDMWLPVETVMAMYGLDDFEPAALEAFRVEGHLTGIPYGVWPSAIFYNRDLFDAAGVPYPPHEYGEPYADGDKWTIEKLEEVAMWLTLDAQGNNATDPDFDPDAIEQWGFHGAGDFRGKLALFGPGTVIDEESNARISENWRQGIHWYHDAMWDTHFHVNQRTKDVWGWDSFDDGVVAMHLDPLWFLCCLTNVPHWDVAAVPSVQGTATARAEFGGIGILNTTAHPAEAAEVAYALTSDVSLLAVWGSLPARRSLQAEYVERLRQERPEVDWQVLLDSLDYADYTWNSRMPNQSEAWNHMEDFADLIEEEKDLELDIEIDRLELELQDIFAE
jgi:multiple sugar transport system substrate-binding protein